jgi:hypothetical protein
MIYRILVDYRQYEYFIDGRILAVSCRDNGCPEDERLTGAGFGNLAGVMWRHGLQAPEVLNPRARFYFTAVGWRQVGRHVAAQARLDGHVTRVIRRKNPGRSQVVYRDNLQVALLPRKNHAEKP